MPQRYYKIDKYYLNAILWVFGLSLVNLLRLKYFQMDLFFDEAQYWSWAKDLDFGYYSKPPMVAWMIALTTSVCGDTEFCVRLSSPLLHAATAIVIFNIARILYNKEKAFYSALVYITMPAVLFSSGIVSTDPSLLFFWSLTLLFFVKAVKQGKLIYWLFSGVAFGAGMLSKYNMLLFAFSAIIYLWLNLNNKRDLFSTKFMLAALMAFLVFSPNLIWNLNNGLVSFLHTSDNARGSGVALYPMHMLQFITGQLAIFGPIMFSALVYIFCRIKNYTKYIEERLLVWQILPLFILITAISMLSRAHANWAAPVYVPATILVTSWLIEHHKKILLKISIGLHVATLLIFLNFENIVYLAGFKLSGEKTSFSERLIKDPFLRVKGWHEFGTAVKMALAAYPDTLILTDARKTHAELLYYTAKFPEDRSDYIKPEIVKWNISGKIGDHFDLKSDLNQFVNRDFIFITSRSELDNDITDYFISTEKIGNISLNPHQDAAVDYYLYYLQAFKGASKE